ncbi:hypothetical protein F0562_022490 [Nyssa sinensis]|uniref:Uncharacterized protein n=1 Tax=Nyssa sinensis TaxID=561372 RepID=A0A5J5BQS1_9ASTE|nr:hypothetical protein F0562_022490 [Nyssa sinensis]
MANNTTINIAAIAVPEVKKMAVGWWDGNYGSCRSSVVGRVVGTGTGGATGRKDGGAGLLEQMEMEIAMKTAVKNQVDSIRGPGFSGSGGCELGSTVAVDVEESAIGGAREGDLWLNCSRWFDAIFVD